MLTFRMKSLFFYALAIAYYVLVEFKHFGDMQHGGTVIEWLGLQVLAVIIVGWAWMLLPQVVKLEKVVLVLCVVYPVIGLTETIMSMVNH